MSKDAWLISLRIDYRKKGDKEDWLERKVRVKKLHHPEKTNQLLHEFVEEYIKRGITIYHAHSDILEEVN
jgi:cytosine/adenosine deaminase-related metal-dependent hydrolase